MYNVTQTRSRNHCCSGKAISVTYSECVSVALGIQHAMLMRRIVSGLSGYAIFFHISHKRPYFSTLSHKWYDFRNKKGY